MECFSSLSNLVLQYNVLLILKTSRIVERPRSPEIFVFFKCLVIVELESSSQDFKRKHSTYQLDSERMRTSSLLAFANLTKNVTNALFSAVAKLRRTVVFSDCALSSMLLA